MICMTHERFEQLVRDALKTIPAGFRKRMQNIAVVVDQEPGAELLKKMRIEPPDTLFGLYQGVPLTSRGWDYGNTLPDRVTIFQGPIEDACRTDEEIVVTVGETLIHELGHYFGLSEEALEEIEDRYWYEHAPEDKGGTQGDA